MDPRPPKPLWTRSSQTKPRNYLGILTAYQRLLRLELEKRHAIVESAESLRRKPNRATITADLQSRHGSDVTTEFRTGPELLGGIRVKLGSTVWDGTVKARLETLRDKVSRLILPPLPSQFSSNSVSNTMSNILQELESQIAGLKTAVTKSNVGIVREIGDGVAKDRRLSRRHAQ